MNSGASVVKRAPAGEERSCRGIMRSLAVYVDDAAIPWRGRLWFHLVADTPAELHEAAGRLGLRPEWAQDKGRTLHYDVPQHVRQLAIELGAAQPIAWRDLVRRRRAASFA